MNRTLTAGFLLVFGALTPIASGAQEAKSELRYSFTKGEKFTFGLKHGLSVRLDRVPEMLQGVLPEDPIDIKFEGLLDAEVTEVAGNGSATIQAVWRTAKAKGHVMVNDIDFDYDVAKKGEEKTKKKAEEDPALQAFGDLQDQLGTMVRAPLKLSVDTRGKVTVLDGGGRLGEIESAFRSLNGLMGPLPKEKVGTGDSWNDEQKLGMPGVGGNVDIKIRSKNTIDSVEKVDGDDCLVVKSKFMVGKQAGEKDEPVAPPGIEAKIKTDGEGEGKTYFSLSKSRSIKSQSAMKVKVSATIPDPGGGGADMEIKAVLKIESSHQLGK